MPGTDDYPLNHDVLSSASIKIQAVVRGRHDRKVVRKKRAMLVHNNTGGATGNNNNNNNNNREEKTSTATDQGPHVVQGNWVQAWDPRERSNFYYNVNTDTLSWVPPKEWVGASTDDTKGYGRGRTAGEAPSTTPTTAVPVPVLPHIQRTATGPERTRATTLIQTQARILMAKREVRARLEVKRMNAIRHGGQLPPDEDFREAGNKLRNEIKQSRRLVAMKEKRIEQLEQGMDDRKVESELRAAEMVSLRKKLTLERNEITNLEAKRDASTLKVKEYMQLVVQKDAAMALKANELEESNKLLNQSKKMIKRRDEQLKRKDTQIQNMKPDTEEVCLSARSFSENMMINLRDKAIDAKEEQLVLLNGQNVDLSNNITRVESEVENMQNDLLKKDEELTIRRKKITHLTNNIDRLERELQKKGGEEAAIELTNKQNANLLVLLQQHEAKTESLEEVRSELEEELEGLRTRYKQLMETSAEFEASVIKLSSDNKKMNAELTTGQMEWIGLKSQLTLEVEETKRVARVRIDAMQEELRTRREKQYATLSRLQAADEGLRKSQDEQERLQETCSVLQERLFEMEKETIDMKQLMNEELAVESNKTTEVEKWLEMEKRNTLQEKDAQKGLKKQLQEMAATILKLVEKNKETSDIKHQTDNEIMVRDGEMRTLEERVSKLILETSTEGKARVKAETTAEVMSTQLNALRRENNLMQAAVTQSAEDWETRHSGLKKRLSRIKSRLNSESIARRNAMERYFKQVTCVVADHPDDNAGSNTGNSNTGNSNTGSNKNNMIQRNEILNLSNCAMTDSEIKLLSSLFGRAATNAHRYRTIDLSYNRITDDGIRELTAMIPGGTFAECIDLSGNMMSGDGARMLADVANQCSTVLGVQHVYVHQDAKIQALGSRPKRWQMNSGGGGSGDREEDANEEEEKSAPQSTESTGTVLTFDCRNNEPPASGDGFGLSSVISTNSTGMLTGGVTGGGSSMLHSNNRSLSKKSKNEDAKRNEAARNRRLEKAYGNGGGNGVSGVSGGGSSILGNQLRNNSSILSVGNHGSGLLSSGTSSIESQTAATAGALARRSKTIKNNDRRNNTLYQDMRGGSETGLGNTKKTKRTSASLPNLHN